PLSPVGQGEQSLAIIARTQKGAGISFVSDREGWHGKALSKEEAARAIAELQPKAKPAAGVPIPRPAPAQPPAADAPAQYPPLNYKKGEMIATREAYGNALLRIGE